MEFAGLLLIVALALVVLTEDHVVEGARPRITTSFVRRCSIGGNGGRDSFLMTTHAAAMGATVPSLLLSLTGDKYPK